MLARDAARIFHYWALSEGVMPESIVPGPAATAEELALVVPITQTGKQLLRAKQVQSLAFNEALEKIIVFTKKVAPAAKKQVDALPRAIENIGIQYRQGLQIPIGHEPAKPFGGPAYSVRTAGQGQFYACGSSISVGNWRDAGTLGCLVKDHAGAMFGLTNNHVSGSCSFAGVGLPILAPGICDVAPKSLPPFTIGLHQSSLPFVAGSADNIDPKTNLDAAIFSIANENLVSSFQGDTYDTPTEITDFVSDMEVEKVGRTTQHTRGKVVGEMYGAFPVFYTAGLHGFTGNVFFEPVFAITGIGGLFSDSGDSGSLITAVIGGQRKAVGLVIAGMTEGSAAGGKTTVALPPILAGLGISLVSGHNV